MLDRLHGRVSPIEMNGRAAIVTGLALMAVAVVGVAAIPALGSADDPAFDLHCNSYTRPAVRIYHTPTGGADPVIVGGVAVANYENRLVVTSPQELLHRNAHASSGSEITFRSGVVQYRVTAEGEDAVVATASCAAHAVPLLGFAAPAEAAEEEPFLPDVDCASETKAERTIPFEAGRILFIPSAEIKMEEDGFGAMTLSIPMPEVGFATKTQIQISQQEPKRHFTLEKNRDEVRYEVICDDRLRANP